MSEPGGLARRLRAGEVLYNGWLHLPGAVNAEIMGRSGYDTLTVDLQHGLIGDAGLVATLQAIGTTPAAPLVRVPWLHPPDLMRVLDAGVQGVICPMIDTPEQARALVQACRYAPVGQRSYGPTRARLVYGDEYPGRANSDLLVFAMVETRLAWQNLDAILDTEGLDGVYVGPADLSLSLSGQATLDFTQGEAAQAVAEIAAATRQRGLIAGIFTQGGALARHAADLGYTLITAGSDFALLQGAARQVMGDLRAQAQASPDDVTGEAY